MLPEPLSLCSVLPWEQDVSVPPAAADLPSLSLVIPTFNAGQFLERTLRSVMLSDLTGVEILLMDGGSTDDTAAIVAHYRDLFSVAVSEPDGGQSDAINKGMARASGTILGWLNGDDLLLPDALTAVRTAFRDHPKAHVVVGDAAMTELDLSVIHRVRRAPETLAFDRLIDYATHHLIQPAVYFSGTAWDLAGPLDESLHYAMDADLFLRMAAAFELHHLPREIAYSVYHEGCKTRAKRAESISELALVQARHGGFAEAGKTLAILVDLYNDAVSRAAGARDPTAWDTGDYGILARRMLALQASVERNKALLLDTEPPRS